MRYLLLVSLFVLSACTQGCMKKKMYIDEFGTMDKVTHSFDAMNISDNWKSIGQEVRVVFCNKRKEHLSGCTPNKCYVVEKYLPKKFNSYRMIIFKDDFGEEGIFLLENLPNNKQAQNLKTILERIDP